MKLPGFYLRCFMIPAFFCLLFSPLSAQRAPKPLDQPTVYAIRYVRADRTAILESPTFLSREIMTLEPYQKILVVESDSTDWLVAVYPMRGYVNRYMVYTEREVEQLFQEGIVHQAELNLILEGKTPYEDILRDSSYLPYFDRSRLWLKDNRYRVKIVNTSVLNVRKYPSPLFDTVGQYSQWDRMIADITYHPGGGWDKVVFPIPGFVNNSYLLTDQATRKLHEEEGNKLMVFRNAISSVSIAQPENREELNICANNNQDSEVFSVQSGEFIARKNLHKIPESSIDIWWSDTLDLNQNSYPGSVAFNLLIQDTSVEGRFRVRLFYRSTDDQDYQSLGMAHQQSLVAGVPGHYPIGGDIDPLDHGVYDFRVEIYDESTRDLFAVLSGLDREELVGLNFENEHVNKLYLQAMMSFSPVSVPMEGVFTRLGFPFGANIELGREGGRIFLGYGYNSMKAVSASGAFNLETATNFLYVKWIPMRLFNDHLDLFLSAGPIAWSSKISNVIHPEHQDYYPMESQKGFHVMGGMGMMFNFKNFLIGVQYHLYGSPLAVFGEALNEPDTQEELDNWIPSNQYKLHTGSNQIQLLIGYRFHR